MWESTQNSPTIVHTSVFSTQNVLVTVSVSRKRSRARAIFNVSSFAFDSLALRVMSGPLLLSAFSGHFIHIIIVIPFKRLHLGILLLFELS